jgi:hypothetical protein
LSTYTNAVTNFNAGLFSGNLADSYCESYNLVPSIGVSVNIQMMWVKLYLSRDEWEFVYVTPATCDCVKIGTAYSFIE